jgi:hypothetical protein
MSRSLLFWRGVAIAAALLVLSAPLACIADESKKADDSTSSDESNESRFMRVVRDKDDKPLAMQTAIKRYVPADNSNSGLVVDLVGAVHIADGAYYQNLNKDFEKYDALLFELVAAKGNVPRKGQNRSTGIISGLQNFMKDMLGLEFQLEQIDYERPNFVHADMTPTEFSKAMQDRGESPITMFLRLMQASAEAQSNRKREPASPLEIFSAILNRDRAPGALKRIMADELGEADVMLEALNGEEGSTLITDRNKVALKVLREQIDGGKKTIGIFYGSGHMPDMEKRLIQDFGFKLKETRWLTAWDLKETSTKKPARPVPGQKPEKEPEDATTVSAPS